MVDLPFNRVGSVHRATRTPGPAARRACLLVVRRERVDAEPLDGLQSFQHVVPGRTMVEDAQAERELTVERGGCDEGGVVPKHSGKHRPIALQPFLLPLAFLPPKENVVPNHQRLNHHSDQMMLDRLPPPTSFLHALTIRLPHSQPFRYVRAHRAHAVLENFQRQSIGWVAFVREQRVEDFGVTVAVQKSVRQHAGFPPIRIVGQPPSGVGVWLQDKIEGQDAFLQVDNVGVVFVRFPDDKFRRLWCHGRVLVVLGFRGRG